MSTRHSNDSTRPQFRPLSSKLSANQNKKRLILVGLGPHAQRIYYPFLEKYARRYNIEIPLVIDLKSKADVIHNYLSDYSLQPQQIHLIDKSDQNQQDAQQRLTQTLAKTSAHGCDGIIIASEAQTHETYIRWALDHDLDILTDKPITAPTGVSTSIHAAESIYSHYAQLERQLECSNANLIVQCQRRSHVGYQLIQDYLTEFLQTYEIPISYLNIYHADGMWPMPTEMFSRENHPYKYGYGKLMHSGYHFIDLFVWLAGLNNTIAHKAPNNVELFVQTFRPSDLLHQVDQHDYQRLFSKCRLDEEQLGRCFTPERHEQAKSLGELDAFIQCQLKQDDSVVTTGSIELQQNSFSRRAWAHEPADVYKGNGRVRHERINLQVGNLLNIQVHSYQSYESKKGASSSLTRHGHGSAQLNAREPSSNAGGGPGHDAHFDIHIYRNSDIVGGKSYEKYAIGSDQLKRHQDDHSYLGHNEKAREKLFLDFINGRASDSHFATHKMTNLMLAKIYRCMAQAHTNQVPYTTFSL